ncbi:MAG: GNAT family N-acetyltransferase [Phycisphaerae bacterium]
MTDDRIDTVLSDELTQRDLEQLRALRDAVYPPQTRDEMRRPLSDPAPEIDWPPARRERYFLLRRHGELVATSRLIPRRIRTADGAMDVLGLAGVKTHPDFRKQGLGAAVVRAAFAGVDDGSFPVSLFQTGVPGFYRKLGAREVDNRFVNRFGQDPAERPWWDKVVMIYPADADWPDGEIDLLGPAW